MKLSLLKIITIFTTVFIVVGCTNLPISRKAERAYYHKQRQENPVAQGYHVNLADYVQQEKVKSYISSAYVSKFNTAIQLFKDHMKIYSDNKGSYFVWSPHRIKGKKNRRTYLRYNLFWGNENYVFQFKATCSYYNMKKLNKFDFSIKEHDITGVCNKHFLSVECNNNNYAYTDITETNIGQHIINTVKFIPYYPKRWTMHHFTKWFKHIYVDVFAENLIPGEERFFIGSPSSMEEKRIIEIVSHECDMPQIFRIEGGKSYEMPEGAVLRFPFGETKNLGINKSIKGVPYYELPLNYPLPCRSN